MTSHARIAYHKKHSTSFISSLYMKSWILSTYLHKSNHRYNWKSALLHKTTCFYSLTVQWSCWRAQAGNTTFLNTVDNDILLGLRLQETMSLTVRWIVYALSLTNAQPLKPAAISEGDLRQPFLIYYLIMINLIFITNLISPKLYISHLIQFCQKVLFHFLI